jgi:hypothetical protein
MCPMIITRQRVYEAAAAARDLAEAAVLEILHEKPNIEIVSINCRAACNAAEKAQRLAEDWLKSTP